MTETDPPPEGARRTWIYRGSRRDDVYLFLAERDGFEAVPDELARTLGRLTLVMELDLHPGRRLASEDPRQVLANLERRGFHLQMPPANPTRDGPGH